MKKCKKCGRPMGSNNYCSVCDKDKLRAAQEKQKKQKKLPWLIGGIVAACVAILAVVLLLTQCGGSEPEALPEETAAAPRKCRAGFPASIMWKLRWKTTARSAWSWTRTLRPSRLRTF